MSPKTSWKDVITERQKESFVGRKDYLKQFTENFDSDIPNYLLFFVIGEGGVGKSTLLKQFESIDKEPEIGAIVITCDDDQSSPVSAMGYIAEQLGKVGINSKEFNERYKTYRTRRDEIESDPKAPRGALNLVVRGMTDFAIKAARRAPGVGVFAEYVDEKEAGEALTQGINYLVDRIGNKDEVQLLREPEKILTPLFIDLINNACNECKLVLMFDVFERTREALEPWLLEFLDFKFGEFDTGTTFVISGRDTVDQRWTQIASSICYITLEPFTLEETRSYLRFRKITNKQLVAQIFEDTGGLPVLVELLAGTNPKPGSALPDISKDAVKRFLQWIPEEDRRWVALLAAVPRKFNLDILSATLDKDAHNDFNWLSVQSYIRTSATHGWFYHEKVRELMLKYLRNTNPSDLATVHEKLANFFEAQQKNLGLDDKAVYTSNTWREFEIERVYHLLSGQPNVNFKFVVNAFLQAYRWMWRFAGSIVQVSKQASHEIGSNETQQNVQILLKFHQAYDKNEYEEFIKQASVISSRKDLSAIAKAALLNRRGEVFRATNRFEEALADLDESITIDNQYTLALINRGNTYRQMKKYDLALRDFDKAIVLDNNRASAFAGRGYTYQLMSDYENALKDYDRAIGIDDKYQWAIANRGSTYQGLNNYEKALEDFNKLILINKEDLWALTSRGNTYQLMGEYKKARSDYDSVIANDENHAWAIANRGNNKRLIGEFEQALLDYARAIEIKEDYTGAIENRARTFELMGKPEEALTDLDHLVTLDKNNSWAIAHRGNVYRKLGEYEKAISDFNSAISLDENYAWAIAQRGHTYRQMEEYELALKDYDRAIGLDDKDAWAINARGYVYQLMGKNQEAIENYDNAISIDKAYSQAIINRGNIYKLIGEYNKALSDFSQLIELDENNAGGWANRGDLYWEIGDLERALIDFNKAVDLDKSYHWAWERKALILRSLNLLQEALDTLVQAQIANKKCNLCISASAEIQRRMGNYEAALSYFNLSIELDPNGVSFELSRRAAIYQATGNLVTRDEDIAHVMSLSDDNAPILYNKAVVCTLINRHEEALNLLRGAIHKDPSARTYARCDDLFKPLEIYPDFQELIKQPST